MKNTDVRLIRFITRKLMQMTGFIFSILLMPFSAYPMSLVKDH